MKYLSLILFVSIPVIVLSQERSKFNLSDAANIFDKFANEYHKVYKDAGDRLKDFEAFKKNLANINPKNLKKYADAFFAINKFANLLGD